MAYGKKFRALKQVLEFALPTIHIDEQDTRRKQQLTELIAHYRQLVITQQKSYKEAFFALLRQTAILLTSDVSRGDLIFRQALKDAITGLAIDYASSDLLVEQEEYEFVFLYENARLLFSGSALAQLNTLFENASDSLAETNLNMALLFYQQLTEMSGNSHRVLTNLLVGYLTHKTNQAEIRQAKEIVEQQISPLTLQDYIFYRMLAGRASWENSFFESMMNLLKKQRSTNGNAFGLLAQYFVTEANALYQSMKNLTAQTELKEFIDGLQLFITLVNDLQNKSAALSEAVKSMKPGEKFAYIAVLKNEVSAKRAVIEEAAASLEGKGQKLFDQGKPKSPWHFVLGAGLLVIGAGLLLAGIAALVTCPLAVGVAGAMTVSSSTFGITSSVLGSVSLVGSGLSFFKAAGIKPSNIATVGHQLIQQYEKIGLQAYEKINQTNVLGVEFQLKLS